MVNTINTEAFAETLRQKIIQSDERRLLISVLEGSDQENDLSMPTNCKGVGRIRHFKHETSPGWPINPLPTEPAARALGLKSSPQSMMAQVFQNAACPWRCWYCFVPYNLLSADSQKSRWLSAEDLVSLYLEEDQPPCLIDLSGGSPDLVPEWSVWMMEALEAAGLNEKTFLWTDDNLSTTYLFDRLSHEQLDRLQAYPNYGRVCCFKGYDSASFTFNTRASETDFERQFQIMRRLLTLDIDLYGYLTLTAQHDADLKANMSAFVDHLQELSENLPLRIIPLRIGVYGPVEARMTPERQRSLEVQEDAIACWLAELDARFTEQDRTAQICEVSIKGRGTTT